MRCVEANFEEDRKDGTIRYEDIRIYIKEQRRCIICQYQDFEEGGVQQWLRG